MSHRERGRHTHVSSASLGKDRGGKGNISGLQTWLSPHKSVFSFLLVFGILMSMFYIFVCFVPVYSGRALPAYHHFIAKTSAGILSLLGEHITATGINVDSPRFSLLIKPGCDAVEVTALFVCAVIAFPASFSQKAAGIIVGVFALAALNLVRVVSLFLIGTHLPDIVDMMHLEVWQGLFIISAVAMWVVWLIWISRNPAHIQTTGVSMPCGS